VSIISGVPEEDRLEVYVHRLRYRYARKSADIQRAVALGIVLKLIEGQNSFSRIASIRVFRKPMAEQFSASADQRARIYDRAEASVIEPGSPIIDQSIVETELATTVINIAWNFFTKEFKRAGGDCGGGAINPYRPALPNPATTCVKQNLPA